MRRILGTLALLTAFSFLAPSARASIILVDPTDIIVPQTAQGVYVDLVTGANQTFLGPGGWDLNFWDSSGTLLLNSLVNIGNNTFPTLVVGSPVSLLSLGTPISSANATTAGSPALLMTNFYGQTGYFGLRFYDESSSQYLNGWVQMSVGSSNGYPASILSWAYETTPGATILAGDTGVPEPSTWMTMLGGLGALGAIRWRRRRS